MLGETHTSTPGNKTKDNEILEELPGVDFFDFLPVEQEVVGIGLSIPKGCRSDSRSVARLCELPPEKGHSPPLSTTARAPAGRGQWWKEKRWWPCPVVGPKRPTDRLSERQLFEVQPKNLHVKEIGQNGARILQMEDKSDF
ncbi:MAG TPA: hypothetical protein PKZ53_25625 [Acidobacteriota bacterium]|nr:hypothetical protein [Acidobacteriota bacterium]HNJ43887.1 hypothetical protein [Acidobacteriota bacterium]